MDRSTLYRSLKKGNPEWKTVEKILDHLGYDLMLVEPPAHRAGLAGHAPVKRKKRHK
jgi:hypothetical protein